MKNKILVGMSLSACALAWAAKDSVIMTVNGVDVPKSEFEYLFHKNSQQQLAPLSIGEYVEMFKIYKLKVADARASGIDTTASFLKEMAQYRDDLAEPYLVDSVFMKHFVEEEALRSEKDVEASHIMLLKGKSASANLEIRQRADSIRNLILAGNDFTELAIRFSQDRGVATNRGYLGFIRAGYYPYAFETAVYNTPEGEISEVVESPVAYHIIKSGKRRDSKGRVRASHIMKMSPANATEQQQALAKQQIDSLYMIVKENPSIFSDVARKNSDDRGSAANGGDLSWFGIGDMVPEFETAAYSLEEGEVSKPVKSQFGWHIILRTGTKGSPTAAELHDKVMKNLQNPRDPRMKMIVEHQTETLAAKHNARIETPVFGEIKKMASVNGIDSTFFVGCEKEPFSDETLIRIDDKEIPVSDFVGYVSSIKASNPVDALEALEEAMLIYFNHKLVEAEKDWLYANQPDYRNLLNEYHDGSLLYEISVAKVWDKAAKDKEGREAYFRAHKEDYSWKSPRVKGILVQTLNDSLASGIKDFVKGVSPDSVLTKLRKEFKGKALFERVLVEEGDNAMVDNIMFGAPAVKPSVAGFKSYFLLGGRLLDAPEEAADVKGQVTSDYQAALESEWIEGLKKKYPVKINSKELKKVK